jgi:hypothetical protein
MADFPKTVSLRPWPINGGQPRWPLSKFLAARINPLQPSQNAALLLNDLTPVDVR